MSIAVFVPLVITANPAVPAKDLKELAGLLQRDRNLKYSYGSTGPGSFMHIIGEAFKSRSNTSNRTRFYVFIRANILRSKSYEDLKYVSGLATHAMDVDDGFPEVEPRVIK